MRNALAPFGVATLVLLTGCTAGESRAETPPTHPPTQETAKKSPDPEEPQPKSGLTSVETTEERRENLEGKLDDSLREVDGLILREQEILEERRDASAPPGGGGGADEDGLDEKGEVGEPGSGASSEGGRTADAGGTGGSPDEPEAEPVASEDGVASDAGELSNERIPPDVGDGSDDDIVARQLREAAMSEEDPALREKLWDEYRAYKFGTKKKENE